MKKQDPILTDVGKNSIISNIQYPISNIQYHTTLENKQLFSPPTNRPKPFYSFPFRLLSFFSPFFLLSVLGLSMLGCAPLSESKNPPASKYTVTFPYVGPNELTFSLISELEGEVEFTFGISAAATTTLPAQLGKGYIKRTLTKGVGREVFMAHLNTIPDDISTLAADHLLKENTTYYLNIYQGRESVLQKSFTTAKFATLPTLERRQGANNIGIHSWDQYFPSNGNMVITGGRTVSTPETSTEAGSRKKIEVKKEEYLILPIRVVIPILAEPSPISSAEEAEIFLLQVKVFNGDLYDTVSSYLNYTNPPLITDGNALNSKTICLETSQTKSANFDAYISCITTIPTFDPAISSNNFDSTGLLGLELTIQLNASKYIGTQPVQNVQLITQ
ncbi:hypothetical protein P0082_00335 [Candidatus Haliotispira prima]|uniref:DUF4249 family protein n=1 Tax=Candidatus Haliotispira prima TaxID=3034016 RepID=A0ABY8MJF2_9SPIO|nr:hypothetical protein P0082_00335 [Candidatus Haliotispira prima]